MKKEKMSKTKKIIMIVLGVLVLLALAVCAIRIFSGEDSWICSNGQWVKHGHPISAMPTSGCENATNEVKNSEPINPTNPTNLKTYIGKNFEFSFQYPDNYLVEENTSPTTGLVDSVKVLSKETKANEDKNIAQCKKALDQGKSDSSCGVYDAIYGDGMVIGKVDNSGNLSLSDWITKNIPSVYSKKAFVNPLKAHWFDATEVAQMGLDGTSIFMMTDTNNTIYRFQKFGSEDPVFNQIIYSFQNIALQFIDKNSAGSILGCNNDTVKFSAGNPPYGWDVANKGTNTISFYNIEQQSAFQKEQDSVACKNLKNGTWKESDGQCNTELGPSNINLTALPNDNNQRIDDFVKNNMPADIYASSSFKDLTIHGFETVRVEKPSMAGDTAYYINIGLGTQSSCVIVLEEVPTTVQDNALEVIANNINFANY